MRENINLPIQMISACSLLGKLRPLRFRYETPEHEVMTIDIIDVLQSKENKYAGIHEMVFTCTGELQKNTISTFDLKYNVLCHRWFLFQTIQ